MIPTLSIYIKVEGKDGRVLVLCPGGRLRRPPGRDSVKAASFEGDTVVPLLAAFIERRLRRLIGIDTEDYHAFPGVRRPQT